MSCACGPFVLPLVDVLRGEVVLLATTWKGVRLMRAIEAQQTFRPSAVGAVLADSLCRIAAQAHAKCCVWFPLHQVSRAHRRLLPGRHRQSHSDLFPDLGEVLGNLESSEN